MNSVVAGSNVLVAVLGVLRGQWLMRDTPLLVSEPGD